MPAKYLSIIPNYVLSVSLQRKYNFYHQNTLLDAFRTNSRNIIGRSPSMVIPLLANQDLTPMLVTPSCPPPSVGVPAYKPLSYFKNTCNFIPTTIPDNTDVSETNPTADKTIEILFLWIKQRLLRHSDKRPQADSQALFFDRKTPKYAERCFRLLFIHIE